MAKPAAPAARTQHPAPDRVFVRVRHLSPPGEPMKKIRNQTRLQLSTQRLRALALGELDDVGGGKPKKTISCAMGSCDDTCNRTVLCTG
jgi:hypothetical protein